MGLTSGQPDSLAGPSLIVGQIQHSQSFQESSLLSNVTPVSDTDRFIKREVLDHDEQQSRASMPDGGPYASFSKQDLEDLYARRQHLFEADLPDPTSFLCEALLQQDEELRTTLQGYFPLLSIDEVDNFSRINTYLTENLASIKKAKSIKAAAVIAGVKRGRRRQSQVMAKTPYDHVTEDLVRLYIARKDLLGISLPANLAHGKRLEIRLALIEQDTKLSSLVAEYQSLLTIEEVESFKAKHSAEQRSIYTPQKLLEGTPSSKEKSSRKLSARRGSQSPENGTPLKKKKSAVIPESLEQQGPVEISSLRRLQPQPGAFNSPHNWAFQRPQNITSHRRQSSMPSANLGFGVANPQSGISPVAPANLNLTTNTQGQAVLIQGLPLGYTLPQSSGLSTEWTKHYRIPYLAKSVQDQSVQITGNLADPFVGPAAMTLPRPIAPMVPSGQTSGNFNPLSRRPATHARSASAGEGLARVGRPESVFGMTTKPALSTNHQYFTPTASGVDMKPQLYGSYNIAGNPLMAPALHGSNTMTAPIVSRSESQGTSIENPIFLEDSQPSYPSYDLNATSGLMSHCHHKNRDVK